MNWAFSIATGLAIGIAGGWLAERLPVPSVAQTVIAVLAAWVLTGVLLAWRWARRSIGSGYVGVGVDNVIWLVAAGGIGAAIHIALDAIGPVIPLLTAHRPMVLGGASGLYIGWSSARAEAILDRLPAIEEL